MNAQEYKIKGWVARDKDGQLCIFYDGDKPHRGECNSWWYPEYCLEGDCMTIDDDMFPDLTWESEPIEVELTIKKI